MSNNTKKTTFREGIFLTAFVVLVNVVPVEAASPKQSIKEGNLLYQKGDYIESKRKYMDAFEKDPESDIINFNLGTSLYKEEQYQEAIDHFQKAFLSEDDELKGHAHYNLGNTIYKFGISQEGDGDTAMAISSLEKSLNQYERALSIDSDDDDTKHNYTFVQKELLRLKEKQQQEQKQQGQGQNSDQSKSDQQQQQDQNQQSQSDQNQDSQENQQQQQVQQQGQEQQDQQNNSDQGHGHEDKEDDSKQNENAAQSQSTSKLTQEEARMRLESYQQAEEPQGQLNVRKTIKDARPVSKDW